MTKPNKLKKWQKIPVSNSTTWKPNFETQSCKSKLQSTILDIEKEPIIKIYPNPTINFKDKTLWLQRKLPHVLNNVVEGSSHVSEGINLPKLSDFKNIFAYFLSNCWLFVCLITTMKFLTIGQKPTRPTYHLEMCFV